MKSSLMDGLSLGGPAGGIAWAACRGASADARGYPCGLWLLFHTLLAQAEPHPRAPESTREHPRAPETCPPLQLQARTDAQGVAALRAIRSYVRFFFGCQGCARHFLAMSNLEVRVHDTTAHRHLQQATSRRHSPTVRSAGVGMSRPYLFRSFSRPTRSMACARRAGHGSGCGGLIA